MGDTSHAPGFGADPDEAAFQRLEQGLAALRRDTARLRQPLAGTPGAPHDPRELDASLAEVNRRIDALASRANAPSDPGPILAALTAVEDKIFSLTARLDRFAEQSVLTEAMAATNAKIDGIAARLDARMNQLQEKQAEFGAKVVPSPSPSTPAPVPPAPPTVAPVAPAPNAAAPPVSPARVTPPTPPAPAAVKPLAAAPMASPTPSAAPSPARAPTPLPSRPPASAFATLSTTEPEARRSHLPALLALVLMVLGAAAALAWLRPDLVKSDQIVHEWLEPARDKALHWLHLSRATPEAPPSLPVAPSGPVAVAVETTRMAGTAVQSPPAAASVPDAGAGASASAAEADPATAPADATAQHATKVETASAGTAGTVSDAPAPAGIATAATGNSPSDAAVAEAGVSAASGKLVTAAPAAAPHILVGAKADAWLMVQDGQGHTLLERVLHNGETWTAPHTHGLLLSTGNAGATFVSIDGTTWPSLGGSGDVRHDLPLDATLLSIALLQTRKSKRPSNAQPASAERAKTPPGESNGSRTANR